MKYTYTNRNTLSKLVVEVGESLGLCGGGGESTSNSGETEHDRDAQCDCDELLERDLVQESLQLAVISDNGECLPLLCIRCSWLL